MAASRSSCLTLCTRPCICVVALVPDFSFLWVPLLFLGTTPGQPPLEPLRVPQPLWLCHLPGLEVRPPVRGPSGPASCRCLPDHVFNMFALLLWLSFLTIDVQHCSEL